MTKLLLPFSLLLVLSQSTQIPAAEPAAKPNIVFVLFDDMGYGQPPCYRADSEFKTPNLNRLAREGMRFTDAHTAASVCTPTRYGVLTGRYPSRIGQFGVLTTFSPPIIPKERLTVASLLKQHGYHKGCVGNCQHGRRQRQHPDKSRQQPEHLKHKHSSDSVAFILLPFGTESLAKE